ncbi:MAG TPA: MlaD family protein [Stellaceae bacterium]|jgi:phospholipid/cholesterol/gamma-HCH transport system substrate-binding protein|nr:MlaD family protein [Stellaceae bacterium]
METRAHYAAVGAFVLTMVALAFVAVLWLARAQLSTEYALFDIYFSGPVSGLNNGAPVEYNGVRVGRVNDVRIDPTNVERIRVTVQIDPNVAIKEDAAASVETNILSGVSFIQIVGGTQDAAVLMPKPGQRYAVIRSHRSRLASVTARAPQLLEKLNDAADRLNDLLDEKNRRAFGETMENVRVFSGRLAEQSKNVADLVSNADAAAQTLAKLLDNVDRSYTGTDGLGNKLAGAITDFSHTARGLSDTNRILQQELQEVRPGLRTFSEQTLSDIGTLVGQTRQLVSGLNRLTTQIERDPSQVLFGDRREGYRPK